MYKEIPALSYYKYYIEQVSVINISKHHPAEKEENGQTKDVSYCKQQDASSLNTEIVALLALSKLEAKINDISAQSAHMQREEPHQHTHTTETCIILHVTDPAVSLSSSISSSCPFIINHVRICMQLIILRITYISISCSLQSETSSVARRGCGARRGSLTSEFKGCALSDHARDV